jgi:hypothetical protein
MTRRTIHFLINTQPPQKGNFSFLFAANHITETKVLLCKESAMFSYYSLTTLHHDSTKTKKSVALALSSTQIITIPCLDNDMINELFYQDKELAKYCHDWFMEQCGLSAEVDDSFKVNYSRSSTDCDNHHHHIHHSPKLQVFKLYIYVAGAWQYGLN